MLAKYKYRTDVFKLMAKLRFCAFRGERMTNNRINTYYQITIAIILVILNEQLGFQIRWSVIANKDH